LQGGCRSNRCRIRGTPARRRDPLLERAQPALPDQRACLFLDPASFTAVGFKDHDGTAEGTFDERRPGLDHLSLGVPDLGELTAWAEHLAAHEVEHSGIEETDLGYHLNLRAPERIPIELFVLKAEAAATLVAEPAEPSR
jgi:hypothetical protein